MLAIYIYICIIMYISLYSHLLYTIPSNPHWISIHTPIFIDPLLPDIRIPPTFPRVVDLPENGVVVAGLDSSFINPSKIWVVEMDGYIFLEGRGAYPNLFELKSPRVIPMKIATILHPHVIYIPLVYHLMYTLSGKNHYHKLNHFYGLPGSTVGRRFGSWTRQRLRWLDPCFFFRISKAGKAQNDEHLPSGYVKIAIEHCDL